MVLEIELRKSARRRAIKRQLIGYAFISPFLIGLFFYILGPMTLSFYLSFTDYTVLGGFSRMDWIGLENYTEMFFADDRFVISLLVTFQFVLISVPLKLAFSLLVAMLVNTGFGGSKYYTIMYYVPSVVGGSVAIAIIWRLLFRSDGVINNVLALVGIQGRSWLMDPNSALYVIIVLIVWQFGAPMLIFLAGLRQVPDELYDSARVDGASYISRFFRITLPMLTPVIFFNLVMQTIIGFLTFTQAYVITDGGPLDATLVYALYLYEVAFRRFDMGYASALAWFLLFIVGTSTLLLFLSSKYWVYYETKGGK